VDDELIGSLEAAVSARPQDAKLRLHLADLLITSNRHDEAIRHIALVLAQEPDQAVALDLMARAMQPRGDLSASRSSRESPSDDEKPDAQDFDWR